MDLGFKIQVNNFGIRIRILKCVPIFRQNGQIWLFWPEFGFWFEIQKIKVEKRIRIHEIPCVSIFRQNGEIWLFSLKFARNGFLVWNSENYCWNKNHLPWDTMYTNFQTKRTTLWLFWPKFAKKIIFGSEIQKTNAGKKNQHP